MTVSTTMIGDYFKGREREKWLASQTTVASLSALLIIWLGGYLGSALGWRGPFYLYAYSLVLVLGMLLWTWEPEHADAPPVASHSDEVVLYHQFPWARLLGICAITLLASVLFYAVITQNGNALAALGVQDPNRIGTLTMLASLGVPLGTFMFRALARLNIAWLLAIDFGFLGVGFTLMGHATGPSSYAWAAVLHQIGSGMVLPTLLVWATRGLAYDIRGRGTGLWNAVFAVGQFVSSVTITFLGKQWGGVLPTFAALGIVSLVVVAAAIAVRCYRSVTRLA
jgi:MFS family permease